MDLRKLPVTLLIILICSSTAGYSKPMWLKASRAVKQDTAKYISPFMEDNENCLKCHGQEKYEYTNETLGRQIKDIMCSERIVRKNEFYASNHKSFSCTDCHSEEYLPLQSQVVRLSLLPGHILQGA